MGLVAVDNLLPAALEQGSLGDWNTLAGEHRLVHDDGAGEEDGVTEELAAVVWYNNHVTRDQLGRKNLQKLNKKGEHQGLQPHLLLRASFSQTNNHLA